MRTKTDKDRKKAASKRLQFNVSLPTVVLDASDCAKLLEGAGKTSVIVVERGGKIVPAALSTTAAAISSSPSTATASSMSSSSALSILSSASSTTSSTILSSSILASDSNVCQDSSIGKQHNTVGPGPGSSDGNPPQVAISDDVNSNLNYIKAKESASLDKDNVIMKPPKKRRGNDKGAYEDVSSSSLLNGETNHPVVSPLRDFTSNNVPEVAKHVISSSSFSPAPSDSLQKHTIENLLQPQMPSNNNNSSNNNNNLISGRISHRPYESVSQKPPHKIITAPSVQTTLSVLTSLPSLTASSLSSSTISSTQQADLTPSSSSIAFHGSMHQGLSNLGGSSLLYSNSSQPFPTQTTETHSHLTPQFPESSVNIEGASLPREFPARNVSSPAAISAVHHPPFQRLPEQDEPMNLSTSSKVAIVSSPSEHCEAQSGSDLPDQRLNNYTVRLDASVSSTDAVSENSADMWKKNLKVSSESGSESCSLQEFHTQENCTKTENSEGDQKHEKVLMSSKASDVSEDQLEPLPSDVSAYHSQSPTSQSSFKLIRETSEIIAKGNEDSEISCMLVTPAGISEDNCPATTSLIPQSPSSLSSRSSANIILSTDADLEISNSNNLSVCDKGTKKNDVQSSSKEADKESPIKVKKPPKKRVEIPMDEESCANRLVRYTGSIDCVITDFVFNPVPVEEEISLTEEEEAIIREQFVDNLKANKTDEAVENTTKLPNGVSKSVDTSELEKENDEEIIHAPSVQSEYINNSGHHGKDHVVKPLKKRTNTVKNTQPKSKKTSEAVLSAVARIESVLAFVAADITNCTPPSEEGLIELDEKYGHLLKKKKKKTVDLNNEDNNIGSKACEEAKSPAPQKNIKSAENEPSESSHDDVKTTPDKSKEFSKSTQSIKSGECGEPNKMLKDTKLKSKKAKKRKSDSDSNATPSEQGKTASEVNDDSSKPKKKKSERKIKALKKKKVGTKESIPDESIATEHPISQTLEERDLLSSVKMETSDLGESIASTSGGSEQVTPIHEPETKDESTSTDPGMDKENHDTGIESSSDDKEKPVRHYKRRLDFVKCSQCDHQARGRSALSRHMKKVHLVNVDMPYKCTICTYGCTKMASLNRHLFTHGIFPCSRCDFKTDERDKLTEHIAEHHKDKLDMKLCKICNRYIKCDNVTIEEHSEKCQGPTPYRCTECHKEFKYGSSLRVHYHTHFPDQPKRFKCELCDYKTNYKANLHKHHKNMHASKDRDIQCPDCGKMFSTEDNMRRHRKVHTLARPFACETCKKTFKTSGALKGHQLIHTATRPFTCNIPGCNRSFRTPKFLKSHQEEFHRLVPKKFFCQVEGCSYSFFKRSHLKRHAITHTGERNYHCTWPGCRKSFRHADNLKVHFRSHTNEKPVQCHLCDFKCKQKNSLFWHKKKVHQIVDASTVISKRNESAEVKAVETSPKNDIVDQAASQPMFSDKKSGPSSVDSGITDDSKPSKKDGSDGDRKVSLKGEGHTVVDNVRDVAVGTSSDLRVERTSVTGTEGESGDLYEFRSDEESDDEKLSPLRREKVKTATLPPLPPPPKELLLKNEKQEQKEREKQEKAERKEQEKKEKAERKEQEKKARAEKKEREKKEKLEKKEMERKEKEEKKELEKKEKEEKKELEKKEKEEKKELEKKEKEEKKELERKQKEEKREQEKKEKEERKEQEKRERAEKKEKEKKERERRMLEVKRLKMEARRILHRGSALKRKRTTTLKLKKDSSPATSKAGSSSKEKKSKMSNSRRKSPCRGESEAKPEKMVKKVGRGRKKKVVNEDAEETDLAEKFEDTKKASTRRTRTSSGRGTPKEEKLTPSSSRSSSPRAASRKSPALQKMAATTRGAGNKATTPPKRKPSARIKANNKAKTKKAKFTSKKTTSKAVPAKKKPGRKKSPAKAKESAAEDGGVEDENEEKNNERREDNPILTDDTTVKAEVIKDDNQISKDQVPRPVSPAYSEENMLQGKASPYRDFSDAENFEEKDAEENQTSSTPMQSPKEVESVSKSHTKFPEELTAGEECEEDENKIVDDEGERPNSCPLEDSSDDEVSNDIPLTPPRAPAPPPVQSSDDEMEPEPDQMEPEPDQMEPEPDQTQPFSVPAPNTPFSNPGPNTPFSVPPPTNLMQQHSVHSTEEMPMSAAVPSVASMEIPSVEMQHAQGSVELHPHGSVEMHHNSSVEMNQSHGSVEMQPSHSSISEPLSQSESQIPHSNMSGELPSTPREGGSSALSSHDKYGLPPVLEDDGQTSEADRKCFDQYLKNLNAAHGGMECSSPSGLQQLEAMVDKSHMESRDLISKSPQINQHHPAMPTSVITSLEGTLPHMPPTELRARIDPLAERHHESLYNRDSMSALPRLPDRQSATPLLSNHTTPAPAFDAFSTLNPLHSSSVNSRENTYLRQQESIFATPPVTSSFMAEAMFQRQAMTTPFLPPTPQASDRSSLSRISDPTSTLRTNNTPTLLRRPTTMPGTDMFTTPTVPQTMPRHPFTNVWPGQDVRPTHWQNPYLPRQPNMGHANSPFFPPKENYLTGREFMFDPSSVRSSTERGMFSSLSSAQTQDSFQMDRFDISNYFPNPMTPYGSSTGTLDYTRSTHSVAPKPFDSRYRQTAGVATSAAIPEFRGLPPTTAAPEMFPSIGVNSGFNLYAGNPMSYHTQHMTDNMNSAFLTHSSSAQHAMLERDYAAAAAHRGLYPHHQNTTYPFIDERQYSGTSKLAPTHPAPTSVTQERDLMSRTAAPETQMQDPYRSMLYRY